jgi:hypothetical protein
MSYEEEDTSSQSYACRAIIKFINITIILNLSILVFCSLQKGVSWRGGQESGKEGGDTDIHLPQHQNSEIYNYEKYIN